jgi:large subunit ribosomal protein L21
LLRPPSGCHHWQNRLQEAGAPSVEIEHEGKRMFAVFKTGGKQYRVAAEDVLEVGKIKGEPGEIVEFGEVLVVGGDNVTLGSPMVAGATVAAEVLEQGRGAKIIAFKKRRRKNSRRKRGHRQEFTLLRITEILTEGKKPSKEVPPRPKRAAKPAPQATDSTEESESTPETTKGATAKRRKGGATKAVKRRFKPAAASRGKKK